MNTIRETRLWRAATYALALAAAFGGCAPRPLALAGPFRTVAPNEAEAETIARAAASTVTILVGGPGGGEGSGVIVWSAGPLANVLTADHVVDKGTTIAVVPLDGGPPVVGLIEARSPTEDLALLLVKFQSPTSTVRLASDEPARFSRCHVVGTAAMKPATVSSGYCVGTELRKGESAQDVVRGQRVLRVSGAFTFPGESGGAVFDADWRLVGIVSSCLALGMPPHVPDVPIPQVGSAVPLPTIRAFLARSGVPL